MDFWQSIEKRLRGKRVTILGVGNKLRGDDGVGSWLAERLAGKVAATVIDAEELPENYLGPVSAGRPEVLMIVDAADMQAQPGNLGIIEQDDIASSGLSTHSASLSLFLMVLQSEIQPDVFVLGIQPQDISFGAPLSPPVVESLGLIEEALVRILSVG